MLLLIALVICFALLWVADIFLFKSRYSSQLWRDVQYQAEKITGFPNMTLLDPASVRWHGFGFRGPLNLPLLLQ